MKNCPTSNMNRSRFWGFEVTHIMSAFFMLAGSNVALNIMGGPLIFSWAVGGITLALLRVISHGWKLRFRTRQFSPEFARHLPVKIPACGAPGQI
jgi:hypothetical protein